MRMRILIVLVSALAGVLLGASFRGRKDFSKDLDRMRQGASALAHENTTLQARLDEERKWRAIAEAQLLRVEPTGRDANADLSPASASDPGVHPSVAEIVSVKPRAEIEMRMEGQQHDLMWQNEVVGALDGVFEGYPGSEVTDAHCSTQLCRVRFSLHGVKGDLEGIMDRMSNLRQIEGERMIEVDDSREPAEGIAYFSRHGAISLTTDLMAAQPETAEPVR